ncbi:MAG TPA: helix-turn-helix domain-containing protein [Gemmataceae bacterium]|jgi:excisionase family DNA binding protein|nr:helix-turn-helix domain-containing protein [Gemmataceae bacterium]
MSTACLPTVAYLSPRAVADRLGLKKTATVLAWIRAGHLLASNVGAGSDRPTWRIAASDLDAFLERRRAVPAAKPAPTTKRKRPEGVTKYF